MLAQGASLGKTRAMLTADESQSLLEKISHLAFNATNSNPMSGAQPQVPVKPPLSATEKERLFVAAR
ncbi:MAG: hypothetical protein ACXVZQ_02990, partial [Terriglobales bacterium]